MGWEDQDLAVEPAAVAAFGRQVGRQASYAGDLFSTVNLRNDSQAATLDGGLIALFTGSVSKVGESAQAHGDKAAKLLRQDASSLKFAARYYKETDLDAARRLDRAYREPGPAIRLGQDGEDPLRRLYPEQGWEYDHYHRPLEHYWRPYKASDVEWPTTADDFGDARPRSLREGSDGHIEVPKRPAAKELIEKGYLDDITSKKGNVERYLSVLWYLRSIIKRILGRDVLGELSEFLAGDWSVIGQLARKFKLHSQVFEDISVNIKRGMYAMQGRWTGRAAWQMQTSMYRLVDINIDNHAEWLDNVHKKIWSFAKAAYHTLVLIEDFLTLAIDLLISRGIKFVGMTVEFVDKMLKAVFGGIKAKWDKVGAQLGQLTRAAHALGALAGYWGAVQDGMQRIPWGERWDHPAER